jgi:endonuclease/exonuclease/phosphatase family metal-dependent hydrolase
MTQSTTSRTLDQRSTRRGARAAIFALVAAAGCVRVHASTSTSTNDDIRVLVYNVHAGKDAAGKESVGRIADVVKSLDPDIVLFQEVDKGTKRSGGVDQPAAYASLTGLRAVFGRSLDYDGGEYGIAVLSRWPIRRDTTIHLPVDPPQERSGGSHEPRVAMSVMIDAPFGPLALFNTHIDASAEDRWRLQEIKTIERVVKDALNSDARVLLGGDFNSTPESAVQTELRATGFRDAWPTCGVGEGLSYPADVPRKRIDYLFLVSGFECMSARVLQADASDHRPVIFTLRAVRKTR